MDIAEFTARRRTLRTADGDIAYTESGTGPAAVFVHGMATGGALWRHVIEQVDGTTRCIAVDLPLHGGTPPRDDPSLTALARLVADLCEGLGLEQIDLVGNDFGGVVAQVVAATRPELLRSLVLTNCDTDGNFPPPSFLPVIEAARCG
jgi:pimeloyl-ACP methyl ester carboxylesterase